MINPTLLNPIYIFLNGAAFMGAWVCGLFFFRFWRKSQDRLFLIFGISFWLQAAERLFSLLWSDVTSEHRAVVYLLRLLAFLVIIGGIWDKNRTHSAVGQT